MGIQSTINQALGTVGALAALKENVATKTETKQLQAIDLAESVNAQLGEINQQSMQTESQLKQTQEKLAKSQTKLAEKQKEDENFGQRMNRAKLEKGIKEYQSQLDTILEQRKRIALHKEMINKKISIAETKLKQARLDPKKFLEGGK